VMGSKREQSSQRLLLRSTLPDQDQETLIPCPACDGQGYQSRERPGVSYAVIACPWCETKGLIDHTMRRVFLRWLRIYNVNRLYGRCTKTKGPEP